jgi:hypothetical protein
MWMSEDALDRALQALDAPARPWKALHGERLPRVPEPLGRLTCDRCSLGVRPPTSGSAGLFERGDCRGRFVHRLAR